MNKEYKVGQQVTWNKDGVPIEAEVVVCCSNFCMVRYTSPITKDPVIQLAKKADLKEAVLCQSL